MYAYISCAYTYIHTYIHAFMYLFPFSMSFSIPKLPDGAILSIEVKLSFPIIKLFLWQGPISFCHPNI